MLRIAVSPFGSGGTSMEIRCLRSVAAVVVLLWLGGCDDRKEAASGGAPQAPLGGSYVNDLNAFGRVWQVNIQAEAADRAKVTDIYRIHVRNNAGDMVPLRLLVEVRLILGPQSLIRYNNLRSVTINGQAAPGRSSGEALAAMERVSAAGLPGSYIFEWTGTALQEKAAAGQTTVILGIAVLFAYLFLVALYESWNGLGQFRRQIAVMAI
jgi:multidrug efflux pump subunit AcrB